MFVKILSHQKTAKNSFCKFLTLFKCIPTSMYNCCGSIVVSTLRCGRNNPGSNPGHGIWLKTSEDTFGPNSRGVSHFLLKRL